MYDARRPSGVDGPPFRGASALRAVTAGEECGVGCFLSTGSAAHAEVMATAGFDAVVLDAQHGLVSDADLAPLIRILERDRVPAIVRVARNSPELIGRALDAGAAGIIVPLVDSVAEAQEAVRATRYPPLGERSYGPLRAALRGDYSSDQENTEVVLAVMIESSTALDAVEQIAAVAGVDVVFTGPADLALSMGVSPTLDPEPGSTHERAIRRIAAAAAAAGKAAWIAGAGGASWDRWRTAGYSLVTVCSDLGLLVRASRSAAACAAPRE